jgi:hypothetical protein
MVGVPVARNRARYSLERRNRMKLRIALAVVRHTLLSRSDGTPAGSV